MDDSRDMYELFEMQSVVAVVCWKTDHYKRYISQP